MRGITRPGLVLQLNKATTIGTKILRQYPKYPVYRDAAEFAAWRTGTEDLFAMAG